jgi:hypothetical protein
VVEVVAVVVVVVPVVVVVVPVVVVLSVVAVVVVIGVDVEVATVVVVLEGVEVVTLAAAAGTVAGAGLEVEVVTAAGAGVPGGEGCALFDDVDGAAGLLRRIVSAILDPLLPRQPARGRWLTTSPVLAPITRPWLQCAVRRSLSAVFKLLLLTFGT